MSIENPESLIAQLREDLASERAAREEEAERHRLHVASLERQMGEMRGQVEEMQRLPEQDWAEVSAVIAQGLALHARSDQPFAKALLGALDRGKVYVARLRARAEQAERGRDEARRLHGKAVLDGSAAVTRAERAEADNAALLGAFEEMKHAVEMNDPGLIPLLVLSVMKKQHPGAALLERLRALEKVREACEPIANGKRGVEMVRGWQDVCIGGKTFAEIHDACAKAGALRGGG